MVRLQEAGAGASAPDPGSPLAPDNPSGEGGGAGGESNHEPNEQVGEPTLLIRLVVRVKGNYCSEPCVGGYCLRPSAFTYAAVWKNSADPDK